MKWPDRVDFISSIEEATQLAELSKDYALGVEVCVECVVCSENIDDYLLSRLQSFFHDVEFQIFREFKPRRDDKRERFLVELPVRCIRFRFLKEAHQAFTLLRKIVVENIYAVKTEEFKV